MYFVTLIYPIAQTSDILLSDLNHIIQQLLKPFLLLDDFNCRNQIWASNYKDTKGKIVEKLFENDEIIGTLKYRQIHSTKRNKQFLLSNRYSNY